MNSPANSSLREPIFWVCNIVGKHGLDQEIILMRKENVPAAALAATSTVRVASILVRERKTVAQRPKRVGFPAQPLQKNVATCRPVGKQQQKQQQQKQQIHVRE